MARPEKRPLVEPELGDLRAEPGSREWAVGARASLWGKDRDLGKGVADVAIRLDALLATGGWKHLFDQHGDPFASIEDYITYRRPYGLGVSLEMMRHYLGLTHEGKAIRAHLAVKGYPTHHIAVASINRTGGTQVREKTDAVKVAEYAEAIEGGAAFPPIVVFFDGETHWLADGFHRVAACEKAGVADVLAEVREGTREDALWFALSANKRHGLPMSNADKQRAIRLALAAKPNESDRAIAAHIGVSPTTVARVKAETGCSTVQLGQLSTKTKGADNKARPKPGEAEAKTRAFLEANPNLTDRSDRQIAKTIGVSAQTVSRVRMEREAEHNGEAPKPKRTTKTKAPAVAAAPATDATDALVNVSTQGPTPQPENAAVAPMASAPSAPTSAPESVVRNRSDDLPESSEADLVDPSRANLLGTIGDLAKVAQYIEASRCPAMQAEVEALIAKWGAK